MSDQRIGTVTMCLTPATLPYAPITAGTRPYPGRHERGLGPHGAGGADVAVGTTSARPGSRSAVAVGPAAGVRRVPAGPAPRTGAVGRALGALAGLPDPRRPGGPEGGAAAGVGTGGRRTRGGGLPRRDRANRHRAGLPRDPGRRAGC